VLHKFAIDIEMWLISPVIKSIEFESRGS